MRSFTTDEHVEDVVNFYRDEWGERANGEPGYTITNFKEPWLLITRIEDGWLMTVQVQPDDDDGTVGLLGPQSVARSPPRS